MQTKIYDTFPSAVFLWHGCCPAQCEAVKPEAEWEPSRCFTSKIGLPTGGRLKSRAAAVTGAVRTMARATHQTPLQQHRETSCVQWKSIQHRNHAAATRGFTDIKTNPSKKNAGAENRPIPGISVATTSEEIMSRSVKLENYFQK